MLRVAHAQRLRNGGSRLENLGVNTRRRIGALCFVLPIVALAMNASDDYSTML